MTWLSTTLGVAGGIAGLGLVLWPVGIWWEVKKCEKPNFAVVRSLTKRQGWFSSGNTVEIRRYAPYLIAEVVVQGGDMKHALSQGFRQIAGFIFGKNTAAGREEAEKVAMTSPVRLEMQEGPGSEKIAMTSPVAAEMAGDGSYKVSFVMPSKYTLGTLPKPHNPSITIREVPSRTLAAISFSGNSPREPDVGGGMGGEGRSNCTERLCLKTTGLLGEKFVPRASAVPAPWEFAAEKNPTLRHAAVWSYRLVRGVGKPEYELHIEVKACGVLGSLG